MEIRCDSEFLMRCALAALLRGGGSRGSRGGHGGMLRLSCHSGRALGGGRWRGRESERGSRRGLADLAHEVLEASGGPPAPGFAPGERKVALVLHGILGNHKNLRLISQRLADAFPEYEFMLATHRAHGLSGKGEPPHSVHSCAADALALLEAKGVRRLDTVIGHSFGGKVALGMLDAFARGSAPAGMMAPRQLWVLDSPPGVWAAEVPGDSDVGPMSQSVDAVIAGIKDLPQPLASTGELVELLTAKGFSRALAQWMTLNIRPAKPGEYYWSFDLDVIEQLFASHKATDWWPLLEGDYVAGRTDNLAVTFVRAERNGAWTPRVRERFATTPNENVSLLTLPDAGHWLHVEKPKELFDMLAPSFITR